MSLNSSKAGGKAASSFTFVVYSGVDLGLINRFNIVSALCKRVKDQLIHKDLSFVIRTLKSEDITLLFTTTTLLCTSYPYGVEPDGSVDDAS